MGARLFKRLSAASMTIALCACTRGKDLKLELNIHYPPVNIELDPHKMEDAYSMMIVSQLHRGLLRFDQSGDVVADLADSWTESPDHKHYRFKLGKAQFSNGQAITAKHVQLSIARIFLMGASMAADLDYIKGARDFKKTKDLTKFGVKPITDSEVEFELSNPSALFLKHLAVVDCSIMPFDNLSSLDTPPTAFAGPYKLAESSPEVFTVSKWRADRLDSPNPPQKIRFFATTENAVKLAQDEKSDSLDREALGNAEMQSLKSRGWGSSPTELTGETFVLLNPATIPDDVRALLAEKVDPTAIVKLIGESQFVPAFGLISNGFPGVLTKDDVASIVQSAKIKPEKYIEVKIDYDSSSPLEEKIISHLKQIWTSEKVMITPNGMTKKEKLSRMFSKTCQATLGRKGTDYPDGFSILAYFKSRYENNYFYVNDPKIDAAIDGTLEVFDSTKRAEKYKDIQKQILRHHTIVPLFFGSQASGMWGPKVKKVPSHPMGSHTMPFETVEMRTK